jgi:hypothetical protein
MKKKIFEYFDNSTEVNKAVLDGLLDEIIAKTAEEAYGDGRIDGYDEGYDEGLEEGYTNGYDSCYQDVAANENLKPENIRKGVDLFGVIGTYEGEPIEEPPIEE